MGTGAGAGKTGSDPAEPVAKPGHYDRTIDQGFAGWIGDVRIVDHPLPTTAFLTAP